MLELARVLSSLQSLQKQHTRFFATTPDRLLAFVGTTSEPGTRADVFARPIVGVHDAGGGTTDVVVRGKLPREVGLHERITVLLANLGAFTGFQLKTTQLEADVHARELHETEDGQTTLHGRLVYTVHPSPNVMTPFTSVPVREVRAAIEGTRYAFIGIGPDVNLSPRFVWQVEGSGDELRMLWGDGQLNKTAGNFARNQALSALVVDLQTFDGLLLRGEGRSLAKAGDADAWDTLRRGFASGGWGEPKLAVRATFRQWGRV